MAPVVLAIDTAGPVVGVALWDGARAFVRVERALRGSDALLLPWVDDVCAEAGRPLSSVDGVAVAHGPGAFTGLRVGLATAAGLALSLGVPLWGGSSLASRAARASGGGAPILAMLDARKARVYALLVGPDGEVLRGPEDVAPETAVAWAPRFVATGEGAVVYQHLVTSAGGALAGEPDHPAVDTLARQGADALARGEGRPATDVRPFYLRPPDAKPPKTGL